MRNMTNQIKIDIVSDVVCPWCIIGYKRLQQAIDELGIEDRVELEWHPYELNSYMGPEGEDLFDHIAEKYGMSREESLYSSIQMASHGKDVGFTFDFVEGMRIVNTFEAHILLDLAKESGMQTALKLRLFKAYFTDRQDVSDRNLLLQLWTEIGLDRDRAAMALDDSAIREKIKLEEEVLRKAGVSAVPTMFFNDETKFIGAQPVETYKELLAELIGQ